MTVKKLFLFVAAALVTQPAVAKDTLSPSNGTTWTQTGQHSGTGHHDGTGKPAVLPPGSIPEDHPAAPGAGHETSCAARAEHAQARSEHLLSAAQRLDDKSLELIKRAEEIEAKATANGGQGRAKAAESLRNAASRMSARAAKLRQRAAELLGAPCPSATTGG